MMITSAQKCLGAILSFGENNLNKDKTRLNAESEALLCVSPCPPTDNIFVVKVRPQWQNLIKKVSSA